MNLAVEAVSRVPCKCVAQPDRALLSGRKGSGRTSIRGEPNVRIGGCVPRLHTTYVGMGYAFIELRRFDEAIVAGKKAQRQSPSSVGAYHCLASAFAHLGRDAEAREAAARLVEVDPAFTISARMGRRRQSHVKLFIEGLRKAGLPE
jgi:adenylate cyclase